MKNAKYYQKVMTYSLIEINSDKLEVDSFHDYKFNIWVWELEVSYSNSEASTHECSECYKRWAREYYKFCLRNTMECHIYRQMQEMSLRKKSSNALDSLKHHHGGTIYFWKIVLEWHAKIPSLHDERQEAKSS